jgi:light-regulated signal transduction histidine kinase (bacteriophytochrome)
VIDGAKRMNELVQGLLAYTQSTAVPESGATLHPIDAGVALNKAMTNLKQAVEESGATIEHGPLPTVLVAEVHLIQLFQNLIENAIKYRGDEPPRISIEAARETDLWRICIHDNGIGIAPGYTEQVFGIFKRLHTSDQYSGTGIGLAICQKIVNRYGGRIWVNSAGEGKGASFCFTLPGGELLS